MRQLARRSLGGRWGRPGEPALSEEEEADDDEGDDQDAPEHQGEHRTSIWGKTVVTIRMRDIISRTDTMTTATTLSQGG